MDPKRIINELGIIARKSIKPEAILIIFDEIRLDLPPDGSTASVAFYNTMFMWPLLTFGWELFLEICLDERFEKIMDAAIPICLYANIINHCPCGLQKLNHQKILSLYIHIVRMVY